ncbi:MAG: alcohol dehydrogenase catalytic domain-containing protein [Chloroflexi bacterium]|nr:alcohol dehydrogenase catalytic domain-containing protein [Chloroflexota bacterium]MCL5273575.1 alcohol dehydrogenase catalytic domain-containing protein [Chloroflexota bacterium]
MRALILTNQLAYAANYPAPQPAPGEALVNVTRAGICNTDLELTKGYMGFHGVLGHEFVGIIDSLEHYPGIADNFKAGDRVVAEINCVAADSPSRDYFTRAQDPERTTLGISCRDGVFSDMTRAPIANLHHVPNNISDDEAVFVEPLAAACQILEQVHVKTTDRVAILGDGKLGLLCAQVLASTSCDLVVMGKHRNKLDILTARGIATQLPSEWDGRRAYDIVVECTGASAGFDLARRMLRPRGTLVLKSTFEGLTTANLTALVVDEITLVGSRCGPFASALRLLSTRQVDVAPLIHARYPLDQGLAAFQHAQQHGVLKVLLDIA